MHKKQIILISLLFIIAEIIIGTCLGYLFTVSYTGGNRSLNESIIYFYSILNLIFALSVISLGVINAIIIKKNNQIINAILFLITFGLSALFIYAGLFSYLSYELNIRRLPLLFTLVGMSMGFNIGLHKK